MDIIFLTLLSVRVDQCRMKMGLILTGRGDKV